MEIITRWERLPLVATPTMAKLIQVRLGKPGAILEMKYDNRFKDGNFRIVKGVVRGNKNTLELKPFTSGGTDK